jgi:superfamily I DNA and RNA helicase
MSDPLLRIPDRIEEGEKQFLNCRVGSDIKPDTDEESVVLDSIETALADSFLQLYYEYPDFGQREDHEYLDIVLLHPKTGVVVIEVYDFRLDDIEQIQGPDWYLEGVAKPVRPKSVASDGKLGIRHEIEQRDELTDRDRRSNIPCQDYIALPNITKKEWNKTFPDENTDAILFRDEMNDRAEFAEKLKITPDPDLSEEELRDVLAILKFSNAISGEQLNTAATPDTKRELLERIDQRLKILTDKQLEIGLQSPDQPQQIRGIAGSGKTVVTAFRAAKLHWEHEDWNIAVTFRNRGLRQTHKELVAKFYRQFSNGDEYDKNKLHIFHAWGGSSTPGMYSTIAAEAGVNSRGYQEARSIFPTSSNPLHWCCREVVNKGDIPEMYQVILIDEGQDLPNSFFKMCYAACTPEKRIYWSYDEAQSLGNLNATSPKKLFGTDEQGDPLVDVSGTTGGGYNLTQVMRTAFRTPRSILMTAHGFGMGMYREGPVVQAITTQEGWDYIGYNTVDGNFRNPGNQVTLKRNLDRSPHPLWEYQTPDNLLNQHWAGSRKKEVEWVADDIAYLIQEEDVRPEEIMITFLWTYNIRDDPLEQLIDDLESRFDKNIVNDVSQITQKTGIRGKIREEGKISLTNIYHSRGNQAPFVYVMGMDMVAEQTSKDLAEGREIQWRRQHVELRNQAFVGFTRTQGWLTFTGTDPGNRIVGELNRVLDDTKSEDPELNMQVPPDDSPFKDLEPEDPYQMNIDQSSK